MANLQIVISALNKASGEINKVKSEIKGVGDTGKIAEGGVKGFGASLSSVIGTAAMVAGAIAGVSVAIKEVIEAAKEGAAFQRMEEASASLARSLDADMSDILDALREASLGMVSDFDLMQAAPRAMMLGVSADSEQLAQLMEVAALRGRAMGISTTQAFNDIVMFWTTPIGCERSYASIFSKITILLVISYRFYPLNYRLIARCF